MALERVRFVHTSDWHLEEPLGGVGAVPAHLRDLFIEAPYLAATRVVDLAIREQADFLLLAGNIVSTDSASPYTLDFLLKQFQRLHKQRILVYWIGGTDDDLDLWPSQLTLPENVVTFSAARAEESVAHRDERELAIIVGRSSGSSKVRLSEFSGASDRSPRIALVSGDVGRKSIQGKGIDYWALGGREESQQIADGATAAWYCGSPQGRHPLANGTYGCNVVELGPAETRVRHVATDAVRWCHESVELAQDADLDGLQGLLEKRFKQLPHAGQDVTRLVAWSVNGGHALVDAVTHKKSNQLIEALQDKSNDGTYTVALDVRPAKVPAEMWEEESILGDFLRAVRDLREAPDSWDYLEDYLPDDDSVRAPLLSILQAVSTEDRQRLWDDVASLGAGLLGGDRVRELAESAAF